MRILPFGDRALLAEFDDVHEVASHHAGWVDGTAGVLDVIPAARTVLVRFSSSTDPARVEAWMRRTPPGTVDTASSTVEIAVTYDGPDLEDVCAATGLTRDQVVTAHTAQAWTAAFCGFAPGFAYLVGGDTRLRVPRRDTPRTSVPAGSVGLAGEFSGVYPSASPGGWQLIGTTDAPLWDVDRDPPALVAAGTRVRFVERA